MKRNDLGAFGGIQKFESVMQAHCSGARRAFEFGKRQHESDHITVLRRIRQSFFANSHCAEPPSPLAQKSPDVSPSSSAIQSIPIAVPQI